METPSTCWFLKSFNAPVFCLLGRLGDTILMFPAFREIHRRTGFKPRIIVSEEYANVYDGISYADPIPVPWNWWTGVSQARKMALALSQNAVFPQWWLEDCPIPKEYQGTFNLTCHGLNWGVNLDLWGNFMASMYSRAGFTIDEMMRLPLVFDRRSEAREKSLLDQVWPVKLRSKPLLLYNFTGI